MGSDRGSLPWHQRRAGRITRQDAFLSGSSSRDDHAPESSPPCRSPVALARRRSPNDALHRALVATINGIAAGMQNTG
jgi:hypothetical protein